MPQLKAGVARRDITPPIGIDLTGYLARLGPSEGVLDPLTATALVLQSDSNQPPVALVTCDIVGFSQTSVTQLRQLIQQHAGIPADNVLFGASHTHAGPATQTLNQCGNINDEYLSRLHQLIVEAVVEASQNMTPVSVATQHRRSSELASVVHNRRVTNGPIDDRLSLVTFRRTSDHSLLAVIFRFTCHGVAMGSDNRLFSADWIGYARRKIEEEYVGTLALFVNGPAANINPKNGPRDAHLAISMGSLIGGEALQTLKDTGVEDPAPSLAIARLPIDLPMLQAPDTVELEKLRAEFTAKAATFAGQPDMQVRCKEMLAYAQWADGAIARAGQCVVQAEVQVLRIGSTVLVALPGEVFVEYGLQLIEEYGPNVIPLGYTNFNPGYIPWRDAYNRDIYETKTAFRYYGYPAAYSPAAGEQMLNVVRRLMSDIIAS